ncbi:MAG: hypothetical protein ACJ71Z_02240 [Aeromicrobium sp.]
MATQRELTVGLAGRVFTAAEAEAAGLSAAMLRGSRIQRLGLGIYRYSDGDLPLDQMLWAALKASPGSAVSHTSSLALRGLELRPPLPVHLASNRRQQVRRSEVVVHRHRGALEPEVIRGLPVLGADRTFVDCGSILGLAALVAAGDWLIVHRYTTTEKLRSFAERSHLDGVQRARVAVDLVRDGAESVRESLSRFHLVSHGLPEPDVNLRIMGAAGEFLGRGDLPFPRWKVLAEYDGWYHERSGAQRQHDLLRRERLEAAGWIVIVLTSADTPRRTAWRVYNALTSRGYTGPTPRLDPRFARWMSTKSARR